MAQRVTSVDRLRFAWQSQNTFIATIVWHTRGNFVYVNWESNRSQEACANCEKKKRSHWYVLLYLTDTTHQNVYKGIRYSTTSCTCFLPYSEVKELCLTFPGYLRDLFAVNCSPNTKEICSVYRQTIIAQLLIKIKKKRHFSSVITLYRLYRDTFFALSWPNMAKCARLTYKKVVSVIFKSSMR